MTSDTLVLCMETLTVVSLHYETVPVVKGGYLLTSVSSSGALSAIGWHI